jgi:hypothetical protein
VRDPALGAIDEYLAAIETWSAADRRMTRLQKKLPEELMRRPRVQIWSLLRGKDKFGEDIKEPIYAHSEIEIKQSVERDRKLTLSLHGGPSTVYIGGGKTKEIMTARNRAQRPIIFAQYKAHIKEKIAAFRADEKDLYARQSRVGWRQAVEAEAAARYRVHKLASVIRSVMPVTMAGAIALLKIIDAARRMKAGAPTDYYPYGFGEYRIARIARNVARFLKAHEANRDNVINRVA